MSAAIKGSMVPAARLACPHPKRVRAACGGHGVHVSFHPLIHVAATFSSDEYKRGPPACASVSALVAGGMAQLVALYEELNTFKRNEMAVHPSSAGNTLYAGQPRRRRATTTTTVGFKPGAAPTVVTPTPKSRARAVSGAVSAADDTAASGAADAGAGGSHSGTPGDESDEGHEGHHGAGAATAEPSQRTQTPAEAPSPNRMTTRARARKRKTR